MKNIALSWKTSFLSALVLIVVSLGLEIAAFSGSLSEAIYFLPRLPFQVFTAISSPVYFWVGLGWLNKNAPLEILVGSLLSLLAIVLIIVGIIDLLKKQKAQLN